MKLLHFITKIYLQKSSCFLAMLFIFNSYNSNAQLLFSNGGSITINAGAQLSIKGASTFGAGSTITNNGLIDQTGNFTNNSGSNLFGVSAGTVDLNGGIQQINGTSTTTFNNLELNGTGNKSIAILTETGGNGSGILDLNNRILELNSNTLVIKNPLPTGISRTTGFIHSETDPVAGYGTVSWLTGNIVAASNYQIPFGNAVTGDFLPVIFNFTTNGIGVAGKIDVSTYPTNTLAIPNNRPLPTGLPVLTNFTGVENAANTIDRFWVMEASGFSTLPTSNIQLTYRESEWSSGTNTIIEPTLVPQRHDLSVWSPPLAGSINTTTNTMLINAVNVYNSIWTLAGNASPLPVELINFDANPVDNKEVLCSWVTASEINNDFFTLERSRNGINFEHVGTVDGAGNSNVTLSYSFTDKNPYPGISYYRLRQTDFDGETSNSPIVAVRIETIEPVFTIFPNPTTGDVYVISENTSSSAVRLYIYDSAGRHVYEKLIQSNEVVQMNLHAFARGIYTVKIASPEKTQMAKLVLQ
ncbi:MAG: T9SS type A sorting domain-containing protein [Bacteroidetes bacterium]|nr:T9SS type A sorting domain-containing protein [Bacteroidota bacterium]